MRFALKLLTVAIILLGLAGTAAAKKHKSYVIEKGDTPINVAQKFGVPVDELLRFNGLKPGGSFRAGDKIKIPFKGEVTGQTYVVKPGDSVAKVADFHGISQDSLRRANGMKKSDPLRVGKTIKVPMELRNGAAGSYVVRKGDTLASIAKKHKVPVKKLAAANKLQKDAALKLGRTLLIPDVDDLPGKPYKPQKTNKLVKTGEKIGAGVRHTVQPGQSLWTIARAYNVRGAKIAKYNGFSINDPLSVGQKIVIPGAQEVVPVRVKGFTIQPIKFIRSWNGETIKIRLMTKSGKVSPSSRRKLSKLAGAKTGKRRIKLLHPRLIHMLQRVAERWPGHVFEVISGYRPGQSGRESKHSQARALDFRVMGIDNKELWSFCKQLPNAGCGYYPNSTFIHMDARDKPTSWVDRSGPGEKPKYTAKSKPKQSAAQSGSSNDDQ
jgi:LysM repeat protein